MADAEVGATRWHVASVAVWTSHGPCPRDAHLRRSRSGPRAAWTLPSSGFPPGGDGRSLLRPPPRLPLPRRRPPPETPRPPAAGRSLLLSLLCWTPPSWPPHARALGAQPRAPLFRSPAPPSRAHALSRLYFLPSQARPPSRGCLPGEGKILPHPPPCPTLRQKRPSRPRPALWDRAPPGAKRTAPRASPDTGVSTKDAVVTKRSRSCPREGAAQWGGIRHTVRTQRDECLQKRT